MSGWADAPRVPQRADAREAESVGDLPFAAYGFVVERYGVAVRIVQRDRAEYVGLLATEGEAVSDLVRLNLSGLT